VADITRLPARTIGAHIQSRTDLAEDLSAIAATVAAGLVKCEC